MALLKKFMNTQDQKINYEKIGDARLATLGYLRFVKYHAGTDIIKEVGPWFPNMVVANNNSGLHLIALSLIGSSPYDLNIRYAKIGTSTTPVTEGDTGLITPTTLTGITAILRANQTASFKQSVLTFYVTDQQLPNGTYNEFGIFVGPITDLRLFARSIITPAYTKGSLEDTSIEYTLNLSNT
jgi:hypothetical protein